MPRLNNSATLVYEPRTNVEGHLSWSMRPNKIVGYQGQLLAQTAVAQSGNSRHERKHCEKGRVERERERERRCLLRLEKESNVNDTEGDTEAAYSFGCSAPHSILS